MKMLLASSSEEMVEEISLALVQRWPALILLRECMGRRIIELLESESLNIVILDTELPDGLTLLKQIRTFSTLPIIVLIAQGKEPMRVEALEEGADDYVIKPPDRLEVQAKVNALLRRSRMSVDSVNSRFVYHKRGLQINFDTRTIASGKQVVGLTPIEYRLLHCLVKNEGRFVPKEALIGKVWGPEYLGVGGEEELRRYICRLRSKLNRNGRYIVTQWGAGYLFCRQ